MEEKPFFAKSVFLLGNATNVRERLAAVDVRDAVIIIINLTNYHDTLYLLIN